MINQIDALARTLHQLAISNVPVDELDPIERLREIGEPSALQIV